MSETNKERVYIIDLLRFLAAIGVLLYHISFRAPLIDHLSPTLYPEMDGWTRYLHMGVRLFFMISGFVIFYSAEGKTALQFAWSRFVRLYPTYWFCATATFVICHYFWRPYFDLHTRDWLINLTMLQEYFHVEHVDAPYWTLAEELRFYGIMFLLLLFGVARWRLTFVAAWMTLSIVDYFIKVPLARYELALDYAPSFAAGVVFYDMFKDGVKRVHIPLLAVTFGIGLARFIRWSDHDALSGAVCSTPVICCVWMAFYLLFFLIATRRLIIREKHFWITAAGGMTYPLYLIHNRIGLTVMLALKPSLDRWSALALVTIGSCAIAYFIWRWIEQPIMRLLHMFGRRFGL